MAQIENYPLFDYQRDITAWAASRGRAAIFADTGLGKTIMQLTWADQVAKHTGQPVLILAPLAVSDQTIAEGVKFGIDVARYAFCDVFGPNIYITNYEQLHNVNAEQFAGIVLDESSILKGMEGKIRRQVTEMFISTPYRLSCTATPSPNDFMELGTQAEFLGIMSQIEMLAMFFIHDGSDTSKWRLKGHGRKKFFEWLATWAVFISRPSDLGYDDSSHELPPLIFHEHVIESGITDGLLAPIAVGLLERNKARRDTVGSRVEEAAMIANGIDGQCLIWCHLNDESRKLTQMIHGAVEVTGSDSSEHKINAVKWFAQDHDYDIIGRNLKEIPPCGQANTQKIEETSTSQTLNTDRKESSKQETQKRSENTLNSTQKRIPTSSEEPLSSRKNTTGGEGIDTHQTKIIESQKKKKLEPIRPETLKSDLNQGLKNTESALTNTDQCLQGKTMDVQFADARILDAKNRSDCTLTTVMQQELSEDCFAQTAISPSGNLRTATSFCYPRQTTSKKVLVSKPSIFGYGLNLQNCNQMIFVGLSDSWEQFYQAVRRCWRYGQKKPVHVHIVSADIEGGVLANIKRKEQQHKKLKEEMIAVMKDKTLAQLGKATQEKAEYNNNQTMRIPKWMAS